MTEDPIQRLGELLASPDESLARQAVDVCKGATSDPETCRQMIPILKPLLQLTSSTDPETSKSALVTLINITSHCPDAIDKLIGLNGVTRLMDAVISPQPVNTHETLMLLTNLTTQNSGCLQILDLQDKDLKGQRLLRLACRFAEPQEASGIQRATPFKGLNVITEAGDEYEYAAMILMNATLMPEGREVFFSNPDFFMPSLLGSISGDNPIRKQGVIGVVRNLCFDQSRHEYLLTKGRILQFLVRPLLSRSIEQNEEALKLLRLAFPNMRIGDPEPLAVNRRNILETLLLLTQSDVGKSALVQHNVVFVMRELDEYETDEENKQLGLRISAALMGPGEDGEQHEDVD